MGLFDNFPYTNFHELNLEWILKILKEIQTTIEQFVAINSLKYADPIQWDITTQYEKNTIVIEPVSGTAYISVQAVPSGTDISNTDCWTPVFNLSYFITRAGQNFANTYEANTTTTATIATPKGGWIVWDSILYEALTNISIGDAYVPGGNIEQRTVEYFFNLLKSGIAQEIQDRQDEDTRIELELSDLITSKVGIEADLRASEDARIELELSDLITSKVGIEAQARQDADDILSNNIGDLTQLLTTDKNSTVDAINEIFNALGTKINIWDVKEHGAAGDGVTDDTQAFKDAIDSGYLIFVPKGIYKLSETLSIPSFTKIIGEGEYNLNKTNISAGSILLFDIPATDNGIDLSVGAQYVHISGITITRIDNATPTGIGLNVPANTMIKIDNCEVYDFYTGFNLGNVGLSWITDCYAHDNYGIGFQYKNQALSGALQWQTQRCFAQENNASGFAIIGVANAANHVTLGMFEQCYTYNNGGYGFYVLGAANAGINGLRLSNCFFGNDNAGGIFINSLGSFGGFIADTVVEACGRSASGRGQSIPINTSAIGIYFIESGGNWTVSNCIIKQCNSIGLQSRSDFLKVVNCDIESNGVGIANPVNIYQTLGLIAVLDCYVASASYADIVLTTDSKHLISNNYLMSATPWRALAGTTNITFNNNITA